MVLDPKVIKALNEFHKTQPALNIDGLPSGRRGILLGDLLEALFADVAVLTAKMDVDTGIQQTDYVADVAADDPKIPTLG